MAEVLQDPPMLDVVADVMTPSGETEKRVIARQVMCPPHVPKINPPWVSEREEYLFSRGWEREAGVNGGLATYRDPRGSNLKGERKFVKYLPSKDETNTKGEALFQVHLPSAFGSFLLEEAVEIQRFRDQEDDTGKTPIQRADEAEKACNEAKDALRLIKAKIKSIILDTQAAAPLIRLRLREVFDWDKTDKYDQWEV